MRNYLPYFIDGALYIVIAGSFLFLYLNKKQPKLYKKWWVIVTALLFLVLAGDEIYKGIRQYAEQRIPSRNELENTLNSNGSIASKNFIYKSSDGYEILIPEGLTYAGPKNAISLIAMNNNQSSTSLSLIVMKLSSSQDLDSLVKDLIHIGSKANPPKKYSFEEINNNSEQRKGYVEASNNGILIKAAILLVRHGTSTYQVTISTLKDNFERSESEINTVLSSFKVQ